MRIEILVGAEDPIIHPFNDTKMSIGSGETNDIIINAQGVSRKHILITSDGENFYVTDQGSTNGSYINEERLVPGRKVEFTSFFPVRLGDDVLVSLLGEDDGMFDLTDEVDVTPPTPAPPPEIRSSQEVTTVIPLKLLKEARTERLVQRREVKRTEVRARVEKKKKEAPKGKNEMSFSSLFVIFAFFGLCYYYLYYKPQQQSQTNVLPIPNAETEAANEPRAEASVPPTPSRLVDEADLPSQKKLNDLFNEMKCLTDEEKALCDALPGVKGGIKGVTKVGTMLYVIFDGSRYVDMAEELVRKPVKVMGPVKEPSGEPVVATEAAPTAAFVEMAETTEVVEPADELLAFDPSYQKFLHELAAILYIRDLPDQLDMSLFQNSPVTFVFLEGKTSGPTILFSMVITPKALQEFKGRLKPAYFVRVRKDKGIMVIAPKFMRVI